MSCVSIHFYIENMSTAGQIMIRSFYLCFMTGTAFVIYRDMVGVGIIIAIGNSGQHTELLAVFCRKLTGKSFRRSSQYTVVMLILFGELIGTVTHISNNLQS